ncbi:MAG: glycosyltransferase family 4 protein [Candidatus Sumerlaea chitinivorans]|nr:glycosyltransferase family 4 protein [Candidatus Sumerlaea chitinivorans]
MKVLHTNFLRGWGGQSNRILMECRGLAERGWEVLLSVPRDSELAKRARAAGLAVDERVGYESLIRSVAHGDVKRFRTLLREFRPDIVHLHGGRDSWIAALALVGYRPRPIVVRTKHNVFPIANHPANRWIYGRFFDHIVCISSAIVAQCAEKRYIAPSRLVLIPSACEVEIFERAREARPARREEFGFQPNEVVVVMSGRLRPEKGHDLLIAAMPRVLETAPHTRFLLLGSGSLKGELEAQLERQQLSPYVRVVGFRTDVAECLAAADIAVQPSRSEGLGTAVLEASAAGLPVVATRVGGIPDIVVHAETGFLVEPDNPQELADAVLRLVRDPELRVSLGSAGRARVAKLFSVEALVEKTDAFYRKILAQSVNRSIG